MARIYDLELLKDIDILYDNEIILYGAGDYGERAKKLLEEIDISVLGFGDSNKMKWGGVVGDKKIFSLHEISEKISKKTIIIITVADVNAVEQIDETLREYGLSKIKFYTYFALKNTIKIHIDDKRIPKEYKERVKIEKMVCRAYVMTSLELDGLAMIQDIILCNKSILILQPGKVGSKAVKVGLERKGMHCIHAHMLADTPLGCQRMLEERLEGVKLLNKPEDKVKIISLIRDPIGRDISKFFQGFSLEYRLQNDVGTGIYEGIEAYLKENVEVGEGGWIFEWFNREIKNVLGIDVYQSEFDKEKGCQIIRKGNVELLLIKTERLNECQEIIGRFAGVKNFKLAKENVGNNKPYKFAYNEVIRTLKIPKQIIDFYYKGNKYMDHFYTMEEKEEFAKKWHRVGGL